MVTDTNTTQGIETRSSFRSRPVEQLVLLLLGALIGGLTVVAVQAAGAVQPAERLMALIGLGVVGVGLFGAMLFCTRRAIDDLVTRIGARAERNRRETLAAKEQIIVQLAALRMDLARGRRPSPKAVDAFAGLDSGSIRAFHRIQQRLGADDDG